MMACPKCSGETRVVDSRPHREDARVIVRRRSCDACGHRYSTQEGTIDIVGQRLRKRRFRADELAALAPGQRSREAIERAERRIRQHLREAARPVA